MIAEVLVFLVAVTAPLVLTSHLVLNVLQIMLSMRDIVCVYKALMTVGLLAFHVATSAPLVVMGQFVLNVL